ncbi:hypothetical protein TTRE_0000418201 [Trichuris trichiura]|uniref:t-SNARE coiled-coil homology domain-containing protein n=1 Tax=Trichuris trichiura TaxID=36087 RepID=A0A077Z8E6_TRITR|nr:hypothetical protein TTRE_0000418201 [Trichuris trichiura]
MLISSSVILSHLEQPPTKQMHCSAKEKDGNYLEKLFVRIGVAENEKPGNYTMLTVSHALPFLTNGQSDGVGIFKLRNPAIFGHNVKPICLPDVNSKFPDLSDCFFSLFDFNKRYMINKVTTCGKSTGTDICYITDSVLPPLVYGSAIICSKEGSLYATAIIVKKLLNRKPSVKNEKRAEVSFVAPLEELHKYVRLNSTLPLVKSEHAEENFKKAKPGLSTANTSPNTRANTMKQPLSPKHSDGEARSNDLNSASTINRAHYYHLSMDLTPVFRSIAEQQYPNDWPIKSEAKSPTTKLPSTAVVFSKQITSLVHELTELETYIRRYRQSVTELDSLYDLGAAMTRSERVRLNQLTLSVIKSCETALFRLQALCGRVDPQNAQRSEHIREVLNILQFRLCKLTNVHSSLNDVLYKRFTDVQRCCKLRQLVLENCNNHTNNSRIMEPPKYSDDKKSALEEMKHSKAPVSLDQRTKKGKVPLEELQDTYGVQFTEAEIERFQAEKQEARVRMSVHKRDIELVEQKLSKLSSLQKTFAENVLAQEKSISRISDNAIIASDNVSDGNKSIKKALQRQTSTRTWLMFIMVVLTFCLWFLHLYHV